MIELELQDFTRPCFSSLPDEIAADFERPIVVFANHPTDSYRSMIDTCLFSIRDRSVRHLNLFTEGNLRTMEKKDPERMFEGSTQFHPHCLLFDPIKKAYLVFSELCGFVYRFYPNEQRAELLSWLDALPWWADESTLFGATFSGDVHSEWKFHLTASRKIEQGHEIGFFHTSLDFEAKSPYLTLPSPTNFCPHMTCEINGRVFNSNFYNVEFEFADGTRSYRRELYSHIFSDLFADYAAQYPVEGAFADHFRQSIPFPTLSEWFRHYYESELKKAHVENFFDYAKLKYGLSVLSGSFFVGRTGSSDFDSYSTSLPTPAHFEFSNSWDIYVSSHNFLTFETLRLLWPAAIDRFVEEAGGYRHAWTLSHPTGYRFTSHKVFDLEWRTKICSIGQTERLFIFDAETMDLDYYFDLDPEFSKMPESERFSAGFISTIRPIGAFEVSSSGRFAFIYSHLWAAIFDFKERRIVGEYEKFQGATPSGTELSEFRKKCAHCQYLDDSFSLSFDSGFR